MSPFRRIVALALLALWWPATMHCRIEVLPGTDLVACKDACHEAGADHADRSAADGCDLFENGLYKAASRTVQVAPPVALLDLFLIPAPRLDPVRDEGMVLSDEQRARPREWVPTWPFARRAAASPRAPSGRFV